MKRAIKFTHTGHSHLVGNFSAGDIFTGDSELCRHFVGDAQCARYADAAPAAVQAPDALAAAHAADMNDEPQPQLRTRKAKPSKT